MPVAPIQEGVRLAAVVIPSCPIVTHLLMPVARIQEVGCFFAAVCGNFQLPCCCCVVDVEFEIRYVSYIRY